MTCPEFFFFLSVGKKDFFCHWERNGADAADSSDEDYVSVSKCFLSLMQNNLQEFDSALQKLKNKSVTLLDVHRVISQLRSQLSECPSFSQNKGSNLPIIFICALIFRQGANNFGVYFTCIFSCLK